MTNLNVGIINESDAASLSLLDANMAGRRAYALAEELFPICRSITGAGLRQTLRRLRDQISTLTIHEVPSGTPCFDWTVPNEWTIREAYIEGPDGRRIVDFSDSNLHVVNYSCPVDAVFSLEDLRPHLHSIPEMPGAIPYVTSYYKERWGFCLPHKVLQSLAPGKYRAKIDSSISPGSLTYGEVILPGTSSNEVFLSTYVCHPSLANNELSGPVVATEILKWLSALPSRRYTYRAVFLPETIGSVAYLSRNLDILKANVVAGFNVTCVGDDRHYSYLPSRNGKTLADRAALHALKHHAGAEKYLTYTFLDRGSDERQYCSPGVDLPIASLMRSKYGEYPEYHTSLDNLDLITETGLSGSIALLAKALTAIENNTVYRTTVLCEPQLGRRGLYPTLGTRAGSTSVRTLMNVLAYADGSHDLLSIAELLSVPVWDLKSATDLLVTHGLLAEVPTN